MTLGQIEHCLFEECGTLQVCSGIEREVWGEGEMEVRFKEQGVSGLQCKALFAQDQPQNGMQQSALDRCNFISLKLIVPGSKSGGSWTQCVCG